MHHPDFSGEWAGALWEAFAAGCIATFSAMTIDGLHPSSTPGIRDRLGPLRGKWLNSL